MQMQEEKELDRQIKNVSKEAEKALKESRTQVGDGNMAKRQSQIDGESDAGEVEEADQKRAVGEEPMTPHPIGGIESQGRHMRRGTLATTTP